MEGLLRIALALVPLALAPLLLHLMASGQLDLGGGEKDVVWIFPWTLWSLVFAGSSLVLWRRGWSLSSSLMSSAGVGFIGVLLTAVILALFGQLGVAGRF